MKKIPEQELQDVIQYLGRRSFSTYDFVLNLKRMYPITWDELEKECGAGGKRAGTYYSAYSRIAQYLNKVANTGSLDKLD